MPLAATQPASASGGTAAARSGTAPAARRRAGRTCRRTPSPTASTAGRRTDVGLWPSVEGVADPGKQVVDRLQAASSIRAQPSPSALRRSSSAPSTPNASRATRSTPSSTVASAPGSGAHMRLSRKPSPAPTTARAIQTYGAPGRARRLRGAGPNVRYACLSREALIPLASGRTSRAASVSAPHLVRRADRAAAPRHRPRGCRPAPLAVPWEVLEARGRASPTRRRQDLADLALAVLSPPSRWPRPMTGHYGSPGGTGWSCCSTWR